MTKSSNVREDIKISNKMGKYNTERFNQAFDTQPVRTQKKLIVYKEPEPLQSNSKIGFAELGVTKITDFSH
jgi:hypothetical protein